MQRIVATTSLLALCGCVVPPTAPEGERAVAEFRDQYIAAFNRCDIDALVSHYAPAFRFVSQAAPVPLTSSDQVRQYYTRICSVNPKPQITLLEHRVVAGASVGALDGTFVLAQPAPGTLRVTLQGTVILQRFDSGWRIVAYHTSELRRPT